jgi:hypothetical protein
MFKIKFYTIAALLITLAAVQISKAACPDMPVACVDGTETKLNFISDVKNNWRDMIKGRNICTPCLQGCGNGLDVLKDKCEAHGGVNQESLGQAIKKNSAIQEHIERLGGEGTAAAKEFLMNEVSKLIEQ